MKQVDPVNEEPIVEPAKHTESMLQHTAVDDNNEGPNTMNSTVSQGVPVTAVDIKVSQLNM